MLQITIIHSKSNVKVLEIKSLDTLQILSTFDNNKCKIDLEPLKEHIGDKVLISHYNENDGKTVFDYEKVHTITKVEQDSDGIWYFEHN